MNIDFKVENGVGSVIDKDTGKPLDWVHTLDIVMPPGATPVLYLGTFSFSASISAAGAPAPAPVVATPATPAKP